MVEISKDILERLNAVAAKRPRAVIQHILKHGSVTSAELTECYGYEHPPRAVRDVRELGIPLVTRRIKTDDGKRIAVYEFGDLSRWARAPKKTKGRTALTRALKSALIERYGARCSIYLEEMEPTELQIDHRIPYEIGGEVDVGEIDSFMLLSPSANRAKSWACEHCANWTRKNPFFCVRCFWAHPENYEHIAGKERRMVSVMFSGDEVADYEKLMEQAGDVSAQTLIKQILHERLK